MIDTFQENLKNEEIKIEKEPYVICANVVQYDIDAEFPKVIIPVPFMKSPVKEVLSFQNLELENMKNEAPEIYPI